MSSWLAGGAAADQSSRFVKGVLEDRVGSLVVSTVLGLGLAIIFFRRVCRGDSCVVVKGPGRDVNRGQFFKLEGDCYQYVPYGVECHSNIKAT